MKFPDVSSYELGSGVPEHFLSGLVDPGDLVLTVGDLDDVPNIVEGGEQALRVSQPEGRGDGSSDKLEQFICPTHPTH